MLDALFLAVGRAAGILFDRLTTDQRIAGLFASGAQMLGVDGAGHTDMQRGRYVIPVRREHDAMK